MVAEASFLRSREPSFHVSPMGASLFSLATPMGKSGTHDAASQQARKAAFFSSQEPSFQVSMARPSSYGPQLPADLMQESGVASQLASKAAMLHLAFAMLHVDTQASGSLSFMSQDSRKMLFQAVSKVPACSLVSIPDPSGGHAARFVKTVSF